MIRINLLGQARPKADKESVPLEAAVQVIFLVAALGVALLVLGITYYQQEKSLEATQAKIAALTAEKASLEQVKQDVDRFESEKAVLQQRIDVIETLQKNRTGAQDLLQMVSNTVVRVDSLWLTSMERTNNSLNLEGEAGSISAVANFITQLKRSGYFDNVEIQTATENDIVPGVETYDFKMTATVNPAAGAGQEQTQPTGTEQSPTTPAKGRS
jgi:type IV pilus assembly protein PilN